MNEDNGNASGRASFWGDDFAWEVIDALGQGVTILGADFRFEYVNPAYAQMVGRYAEELIGLSSFDVTHPDDYDVLQEARQQRLLGQQSTYETRLVRPDGTLVYAHITGVPRLEENQVVGSCAIITNLTERKQPEEKLRESERRYQVLSELTSDYAGSFRLAEDGRLILEWISGAFNRITGYTPEELDQMGGLIAIIHPDDQADARQKMEAMLNGRSFVDEFRIITKDGQVRWLRDHIRAELNPETGQPIRFYTAAKDITARKEAEAALQKSEALYRSLAESSGVGIWQITPEGATVYINPAMCDLLGLEGAKALAGKTYHEFFTPESLETMRRHHAQRADGKASAYEVEIIRSDGQGRNVIVYGAPVLASDGRLHSLIGTFVNVTERRQTERELRQWADRLQLTLDNLALVAYEIDADGTFLLSRGKGLEKLGLQPDEVVGLSVVDVYGEFPEIVEAARQALAGERQQVEVEVANVVWEANFNPIKDEAGNIVRIFGTAVDVTARKRTEEALRYSESNLKAILNYTLHSFILLDRNGRIQAFNKIALERGRQILGRAIELGQDFVKETISPMGPGDFRIHFERALQGYTTRTEGSITIPDGTTYWFETHYTPVVEDDGTVTGVVLSNLDITRRKQAQRELITEKAFTDAIVDSLPGAFFVFNEDGQFLRWNKNMQTVTGYSGEEIRDLHPLDVVVEDDRALVAAKIQEALTQGEVEVEARLLAKDGRALPYLFTGRRALLDDKPAVLGLGLDITDRKLAEEKLRNSEANLRAIFNNTLQAFVLFDANRRVLAVNSVADNWASQVLEHSLREGELADELFARFQFKNFEEAFNRALRGETIVQERKVGMGDQEFWFETNYNPVTTEEGDVVGVSLSVLNVTERKQAEEALRQSKAELQHIINTVPEGVLLLTADGRIHLANPVAEQYLILLAPEREDGRLTQLGNQPLPKLLTSPPKGLWHEIKSNDLIFETIARPVENGPENGGWVLVLRDVTQERGIQQRVKRQERMAAVGQLAAGIAHDFNNILAVITLYAQLILRTVEMPAHAQERMNTIERQTVRATELIQQVLDFSRQSVLERQPLDLVPFMKELVTLLDRTLPEHIQVELEHAAEAYFIHADPSRMQQVIMNLAINARDVMPEGGRLHIELTSIQTEKPKSMSVRDLPPGNWVQIQVADDGSGIPLEMIPHIFEPFFTTKTAGQGTGLGLAQVYGIVKQHEGFIDVATAAGQGTTFSLYFPAFTPTDVIPALSGRAKLRLGQGQKVLVVEDNPDTRKALVDSLGLLNYEVMEATNGRNALSILATKAEEISLVLSDVVMPEMGGVALFHAMRQQNLTMPVVLLTGHPLSKEMEYLHTLGLAGWLPKPPDLVNLSRLLAKVLGMAGLDNE